MRASQPARPAQTVQHRRRNKMGRLAAQRNGNECLLGLASPVLRRPCPLTRLTSPPILAETPSLSKVVNEISEIARLRLRHSRLKMGRRPFALRPSTYCWPSPSRSGAATSAKTRPPAASKGGSKTTYATEATFKTKTPNRTR